MRAEGSVGTDPDPEGPDPSPISFPIAEAYRRRRARRNAPRRLTVSAVLGLGFLTLIGYYGNAALSAANLPGVGTLLGPAEGPLPPVVTLGTPVVHNTTCGDGRTIRTESVPWTRSDPPVSTDSIYLVVEELLDGDVDGGPAPAPVVSPTSVCPGAPPTVAPSWYVVLQDPTGANIAYFTYAQGWTFLDNATTSISVLNGSSLEVVAVPFLGGTSYGLCVFGDLNTAPYDVCDQL